MLRFGSFEIDLRSGELRKAGAKIKLQEQPFQVLALLVARPGELITREELRQKVWAADSFVDFDNGLNIAIRKLRQALGDDAEAPRYIETLPKRGYRFIAAVAAETSAGASIASIAVLPFQNISGEEAQEYFSDGMTEELITELAGIRSLRVISRTSAMQYKGTRKTMPEIGRELNVDAVVEGAVQRTSGQVRITAQLIRAAEDAHLWAASYDRASADVLGVQRQVVQAIVNEIRIALAPHERQRLATTRPVDAEAYEAYLKGRYHLHKLTGDGLKRGLDYLRRAKAIDPNYAPIHAGIAYYYLAQAEWRLRPRQAMPEAKRAAERAIELDDSLAEAHLDLGIVHFLYGWDWPHAEREFRRAIELGPSDAMAHQYYGWCLAWMGRADEAIRVGKRAVELDPVSVEAVKVLGESLYFLHDYPAAITRLRDALDMEPGYWFAHLSLGRAYLQAGKTKEAVEEIETAIRLEPGIPDALCSLATAYVAAGRKAKARGLLTELEALAKGRYVPAYNLAIVCLSLGEEDRAIALLEKAFEDRSLFMTWLATDPVLNPLRSHPEFSELQRRVGLS